MEGRYLAKAIFALSPNAQFKFSDDDLTTLEWFSDSIPPSILDILKEAKNQKKLEVIETQARVEARASALAKLAALGLTADEIAAL